MSLYTIVIIVFLSLIILFLMINNIYSYIKQSIEYQHTYELMTKNHQKALEIHQNTISMYSEILQIFLNRMYLYGTEEEKDLLEEIIGKYAKQKNTCE